MDDVLTVDWAAMEDEVVVAESVAVKEDVLAEEIVAREEDVVLAENLPSYQLEMVPEQVPDVAAALEELIRLGLVREDDLERIEQDIARQPRFRPTALSYRLSEEAVARFAVHRQRFPGVDIQARLIR